MFTQAYNAQQTIGRAIESIQNQTYGDFMYYVLDNGSTDDTGDVVMEYASKDERIRLIRININDVTNGSPFVYTLLCETSAKYLAMCDADDTYSPDFLEKMIEFMEENRLDIASCGYQTLDGKTGEIVKCREIDKSLILVGDAFVDDFTKYRAFTLSVWAKLYSIPFLKKKGAVQTEKDYKSYKDCAFVLWLFQRAQKAGVYAKAMYQYYQYPRSLAHQNVEENMQGHKILYEATKSYLQSYGHISLLNEDFLHAIHLSLVDEAVNNVILSDIATDAKLRCLLTVFDDTVWRETMARDADPQFRNLAARPKFVSEIGQKILALPGVEKYGKQLKLVLQHLQSNA